MVCDKNCIFRRRTSQSELCSNVIWLTVVLCTSLKPNGKFCMGLKGIERLECITVFAEVASQLSGNLHLICTQLCALFRLKKMEMW